MAIPAGDGGLLLLLVSAVGVKLGRGPFDGEDETELFALIGNFVAHGVRLVLFTGCSC
jgi:hypothetical protein